jgi:hypothetical protein
LNRKLAVVVLAFVLLICAALVLGGLYFCSRRCRIGAYYYVWWGIPFNNHWNEDIKGTPRLGYYNSSDPEVADQHVRFAMNHGIDFFAVSWMGNGTWQKGDFATIDQNLRNGLLEAPQLRDFKFCLLYETVLVKDNAFHEQENFSDIFLSDIGYAAQKYFDNPSYLKVNGSPVLFIYNVPHLYENSTEQEVHTLLDSARQEAANSGYKLYIIGDLAGDPSPPDLNSPLLYSLNATTTYHFNDQANNWDHVLANAATYYPQWLSTMNSKGISFVPDAYPGFNNTNNTGASEPWTILPPNSKSFGQMLQIAMNHTSSPQGFVMVTSWNEWMEGTQIEPSIESDELFLHVVYDAVKTQCPIWLLIGIAVLGAIIAAGIVTFYFLKQKRHKTTP